MTAKEFQIWVQEETDFSVLDVVDYDANSGGYMIDVESIFDIAKAYHQSKVNAISDEDINNASKLKVTMFNNEYMIFKIGVKWFKEQLLKQ